VNRKFNKDSKNELKTDIFSFQVGFTVDFVPGCPSDCVSDSSNFHTAFLPDCTKCCTVFLNYYKVNLARIPKICLKQSFSYSK